MSRTSTPIRVGYFGKIPARGDFIKATDNAALITLLDNWLAQAMELLSNDPRWKDIYDALKPLHFVVMGPRSRRAVAGHLRASGDQSQRRFPFISMSTFDVDDPIAFVNHSAMILSRLWSRLEMLTDDVLDASDPGPPLQALTAAELELDIDRTGYSAIFTDFLELQTLASLGQLLQHAGFQGDLRHLLLALGLLLHPVMTSTSSRLDKSLILPLPHDPLYRGLVTSFWMHLLTPFLSRADFELLLFQTSLRGKPCMFLGFSGASPRTLHAVIDSGSGAEHNIAFDKADWVEEHVYSGPGIQKLSSYLTHPDLSLKSVMGSFHQAFIGA
ncbi:MULTISPECIES: type VI secretion system-associated protein TagF [Herbaspirillum]|uniref:Type VI secretion-associated protein n=1 Tax=Herbaspirillum frisingense GSF30 TaxID=864073 RepID=A0AAI9IIT6_9BURK|nr:MULTISPECIES: type VI secretion system-associated protein TagF [Herbaspirillum]EOA06583.1 type VI secretion-associated protein [Herbaspirillum frisingense GSF30]MCI1016198.1 type VI secretion system-associated protein TagF [Herbaspirillum sp. C7C2]ONN66692.1 type VI secretion-associated protein [Herbaspirillum sp. VT-16-41]